MPVLVDFMRHEKRALKGGDSITIAPILDGDGDVVDVLVMVMLI